MFGSGDAPTSFLTQVFPQCSPEHPWLENKQVHVQEESCTLEKFLSSSDTKFLECNKHRQPLAALLFTQAGQAYKDLG